MILIGKGQESSAGNQGGLRGNSEKVSRHCGKKMREELRLIVTTSWSNGNRYCIRFSEVTSNSKQDEDKTKQTSVKNGCMYYKMSFLK